MGGGGVDLCEARSVELAQDGGEVLLEEELDGGVFLVGADYVRGGGEGVGGEMDGDGVGGWALGHFSGVGVGEGVGVGGLVVVY